jgi:hypothetical protein
VVAADCWAGAVLITLVDAVIELSEKDCACVVALLGGVDR